MINLHRQLSKLVIALFLGAALLTLTANADDNDEPVLKPRTIVAPGHDYPSEDNGKILRTKPRPMSSPINETKPPRPIGPPNSQTTLSLLPMTTSFKENTFDGRFSTLGLMIPLSLPLAKLSEKTRLHFELGLGVMYSRVTLTDTSTNNSYGFTHLYFSLPTHLRLLVALKPKITAEFFGGAISRFFEYDGRDTSEGGFHEVDDFFGSINLNGGVGLNINLYDGLKLRTMLAYVWSGVGVEYTL